MRRRPIHGESSGCRAFLSNCANAMGVAFLASLVACFVGGDEMRGCALALLTLPAVFLGAMVYFTSRPVSAVPPPRTLADFKKRATPP